MILLHHHLRKKVMSLMRQRLSQWTLNFDHLMLFFICLLCICWCSCTDIIWSSILIEAIAEALTAFWLILYHVEKRVQLYHVVDTWCLTGSILRNTTMNTFWINKGTFPGSISNNPCQAVLSDFKIIIIFLLFLFAALIFISYHKKYLKTTTK